MTISNRAAIGAGRAWAEERWDAIPARERPSLWPGTIREALSLAILREVSSERDSSAVTTAFVALNAAELRWRELLGRDTAAPAPSLFLSRLPGSEDVSHEPFS
jgi:hypothetical protein